MGTASPPLPVRAAPRSSTSATTAGSPPRCGPALDITDPVDADLLIVLAPVLEHLDAVDAGNELAARIDAVCSATPTPSGRGAATSGSSPSAATRCAPTNRDRYPAQAALAAMHRSIGLRTFRSMLRAPGPAVWEHRRGGVHVAVTALPARPPKWRCAMPTPVRHCSGTRTVEDRLPQPGWGTPGVLDEVVITGGSGAVGTHFVNYLAAHGRGASCCSAATAPTLTPRCPGWRCWPRPAISPTPRHWRPPRPNSAAAVHPWSSTPRARPTMIGHRDLTGAVFAEAVSRQVAGLAAFTASWPLRVDARIVLCSSVSGLWGGSGHTAYSAANRLLDVMAGQLRDRRQTLHVGALGACGRVYDQAGIIDADEVARVERSGLQIHDTRSEAVETCLRDFAGDPLVFAADAARLQVFLGGAAERNRRRAGGPEPSHGRTGRGGRAAGGTRIGAQPARGHRAGTVRVTARSGCRLTGWRSTYARSSRRRPGSIVPLATILGGATVAEVASSTWNDLRRRHA